MSDPTLGLEGAAVIPRSNGEPVFSAPWQSRAFGTALALYEQGAFDWEDFRARLITEISADEEGRSQDDDGSLYYSRWLAALSATLVEQGVLESSELLDREREFRTGVRREVY